MHHLFNHKNFALINLVVILAWVVLLLLIMSMGEQRMLLPAPVINALTNDCPQVQNSYLATAAKPCLATLSILIAVLQILLLLYTAIYFFIHSVTNDITLNKYRVIYSIILVCATFFALALPLLFNI